MRGNEPMKRYAVATITDEQQPAIERFGSAGRARFDQRDRRSLSRDASVLRSQFKPLAGASLADGVGQPETEELPIRIVNLARLEGLPLTPCGKYPSGYRGAVPARGGLLLDLKCLKRIVWLDDEACAAHGATPRQGRVDESSRSRHRPLTKRVGPERQPGAPAHRLVGRQCPRRRRQGRLDRARDRACAIAHKRLSGPATGARPSSPADSPRSDWDRARRVAGGHARRRARR